MPQNDDVTLPLDVHFSDCAGKCLGCDANSE